MSFIKFQHVYVAIMLLSVLSAFVIPPSYVTRAYPQIQSLFAPVARPVGGLAGWVRNRIFPEKVEDQRTTTELRSENDELRVTLASLQQQLETMRQRNAEREKIGMVRNQCTPIAVIGPAPGTREALLLQGSTMDGLRDAMCVLYPGGVVGQIFRAGIAGAQVRLITDSGFRVRCAFMSFGRDTQGKAEFTLIATPPAYVEGTGKGVMLVRMLTMEDVNKASLAKGQWVVLDEPDWPTILRGQRLGKIVSIAPQPDSPLFAEIRAEPEANLLRLREVMVMTK